MKTKGIGNNMGYIHTFKDDIMETTRNFTYNDNLNELFNKVFTRYVEDFENWLREHSEVDADIARVIAEDLEDKDFAREEIETMVMAIVFSESPGNKHSTRYFLKDYEKYNPCFSPNPKSYCVDSDIKIRDKFTAYGLDLLQPYDNLGELKKSVEENYEIDLDEEESQYLFKVYENFFIDEELEQDLDDVERE